LVAPNEPYEGFMGEYTPDFHNDFLKPNWIAFKLNADNKYELLGDFRYFFLENTDIKEPNPDYTKELKEHYVNNLKGLAQAKQRYAKFGVLFGEHGGKTFESKQAYYTEPMNLLDQLGGEIGFANWTNYCEDFGIKLNIIDEDDPDAESNVYPISPAGNRFYFIAGVPFYHYITNSYGGADWIVLYYEPIERIAWFTFDYT
jgi:hypothetical protein